MAQGPEPWYLDPRWWAIIASFIVGVSGIVKGSLDKRSDRKREKTRDVQQAVVDEWVVAVRVPLATALEGLDHLLEETRVACALGDSAARNVELTRIYRDGVSKRFAALRSVMLKVDALHETGGAWAELSLTPEDQVYAALDTLCNGAADPARCNKAAADLEGAVRGLRVACERKAQEMRAAIKRG